MVNISPTTFNKTSQLLRVFLFVVPFLPTSHHFGILQILKLRAGLAALRATEIDDMCCHYLCEFFLVHENNTTPFFFKKVRKKKNVLKHFQTTLRGSSFSDLLQEDDFQLPSWEGVVGFFPAGALVYS